MTGKNKYIYLLLTIACFAGIILIFVFDGYMGIYDTLLIDDGRFPQPIGSEQWRQQDEFGYPPSVSLERERSVNLTYTVENHHFSAYSVDVSISLWDGAKKVADLASGRLSAPAFGKAEIAAVVDAGQYIPAGYPTEQSYNLALVINRGGVERKVQVYINPGIPKSGIIIPPPPSR
jgi:hypothetical protein